MLEIKGFTRNTLIDWDGKIASVVFLPVCNFRCPYCHASALVTDSSEIPAIPLAEVEDYLRSNRDWIDGVVITGGEPTLHGKLPQFIDHLREMGLAVKLFTNGSRPAVLSKLIESGRLDAISMDVKAPLDERYSRATGLETDTAPIRESIEAIKASSLQYEFRTTICPAILSHEDVVDIARGLDGAELLILQQFRPLDCLDPAFDRVKQYPVDELEQMAQAARQYVKECRVQK